eukprot:2283060-Pleurochrysis_carterae.AAC.1
MAAEEKEGGASAATMEDVPSTPLPWSQPLPSLFARACDRFLGVRDAAFDLHDADVRMHATVRGV